MPDLSMADFGYLGLGIAIGAAAMLAVVVFVAWLAVSIGRVWSARGAHRTGVPWGWVDTEVYRIFRITDERRQRTELQHLLHDVANKSVGLGHRPEDADPFGVQKLTLQEVWNAAGGNPEVRPTKHEVIAALQMLDEVCEEAHSREPRPLRTSLSDGELWALIHKDFPYASEPWDKLLSFGQIKKVVELALATYAGARATSVEEVFTRYADRGFSPALVFDDDGRWAVSDMGSSPVPEGEDGHTETVCIASVVQPDQWKPTIHEAVIAFIAANPLDEVDAETPQ